MNVKSLKATLIVLTVFLVMFIVSSFIMIFSGSLAVQLCSIFPYLGSIGTAALIGWCGQAYYYKANKKRGE